MGYFLALSFVMFLVAYIFHNYLLYLSYSLCFLTALGKDEKEFKMPNADQSHVFKWVVKYGQELEI